MNPSSTSMNGKPIKMMDSSNVWFTLVLYTMFTLRFDGGARPNPGPGAGAYWIQSPEGETVERGGVYLDHCTNNIGEYTGLIEGLRAASRLGVTRLRIEGDSMLAVCQITGKWKASHPNIIPLWKEAMGLIGEFEEISVGHILRKDNKIADALSTKTIESKVTWRESSSL
jgi:ribonuclease HI